MESMMLPYPPEVFKLIGRPASWTSLLYQPAFKRANFIRRDRGEPLSEMHASHVRRTGTSRCPYGIPLHAEQRSQMAEVLLYCLSDEKKDYNFL